jgi:hypothetical protein
MKPVIRLLLFVSIAMIALAFSTTTTAAPSHALGARLNLPASRAGAAAIAAPQRDGCQGTPLISYFTAYPLVIQPGQIATLEWGLVGNANAAYLFTPSGKHGVATPGTQQVNPTQTTTYTLVAYCGNNTAQASVTITVQSPSGCQGAPGITSFTANPTNIVVGRASNLQWGLVVNADAAVLATPDGNSGIATPGGVTVQPNQTTTYTLIAWCKGVSVQRQVTVNVSGPPPTPPPPVGGSQITSVDVNGGLSSDQVLVLISKYHWNGEGAPVYMVATPYRADGSPAAGQSSTYIRQTGDFYANLTIKAPRPQVASARVCLVGQGGVELACRNWP